MLNRYMLTVLLGITTAKSVQLKNTTVRNTSSGYHPVAGNNAKGAFTSPIFTSFFFLLFFSCLSIEIGHV